MKFYLLILGLISNCYSCRVSGIMFFPVIFQNISSHSQCAPHTLPTVHTIQKNFLSVTQSSAQQHTHSPSRCFRIYMHKNKKSCAAVVWLKPITTAKLLILTVAGAAATCNLSLQSAQQQPNKCEAIRLLLRIIAKNQC